LFQLRPPFWVVTNRTGQSPSPIEPCDDPKALHAFSSTDRLTAFLEEREAGSWKVSLVACREGLVLAVADAHLNGATSFCFDPAPDGSGGQPLGLRELLTLWDHMDGRPA